MEENTLDVKGQPSLTGFQLHPENINREGGPPKTHWWSELLIEEANKASEKMDKLKKKEVMAKALVDKAAEGDLAAIKEFGDRVQGKAPTSESIVDPSRKVKGVSLSVIYE